MGLFGRLGPGELVLILTIVLVVFGPRRLPELGRAIGQGLKELRQSAQELEKEFEERK